MSIHFQIVLLCCCTLLIQATEPTETSETKDIVKPKLFFLPWLNKWGSNSQDKYESKYNELLAMYQKLEGELKEQREENKRLNDKYDKDIKQLNEKLQKELDALKQKYENEIKKKVEVLKSKNMRLTNLYEEAQKNYNEKKVKNAELQGQIKQLSSEKKLLEKEKNKLVKELEKKNTYINSLKKVGTGVLNCITESKTNKETKLILEKLADCEKMLTDANITL
ncbi:synaptonemal complex protein 1-like isoform X2 [Anthonomus grandis grandis]|uniref:synaptonemal complex protein 1-like isoform X2 n=1 Tax=Anthonomus grandis grandis TaxID=2921223 RepID=UPI0021662322|nr:synaptonemal complex protein 1-like isoform X2 [Anthonomus grandis grandis]